MMPTLQQPVIEAPGLDVKAPSPFYCTGEEFLRVASFGSVAGAELTLRTRFLKLDGQLAPSADRHVPSSNRTIVTSDIPLAEGWLTGAEIHASVGTPRVGQIFVVVDLMRGSGTAAVILQTLMQGYVTDTTRLSYPSSVIRFSPEGPGVLRSITGTDPTANVEINETVATNARVKLVGLDVTLVADANVANRDIVLAFDDGAAIFLRVAAVQAVTAGQTVVLSFGRDVQRGFGAVALVINAPLPNTTLQGGFRFRTITTNRQVGDTQSNVFCVVEEWIEP